MVSSQSFLGKEKGEEEELILSTITSRDVPGVPKYNHFFAGTMAGLVSTAVLYPLDLVKTRYQGYSQGSSPYPSIASALRTIAREEGVKGLYQGLGPALLGNAVSWGGYFFCYERVKHAMRRTSNEGETRILGAGHHLGAGMLAGNMIVLLTNPIWLIKTRMQLQGSTFDASSVKTGEVPTGVSRALKPYTGFVHALATIVKEEGPLGLYRGLVPALLLCSQGALQVMAYEWLKARACTDPKHVTATESLAMGGASKIFSSLVTYPYQVIKTRLQQREHGMTYRGTMHCAGLILSREGPAGFFRGVAAHALRSAPASAITFVVYEETLKLMRR